MEAKVGHLWSGLYYLADLRHVDRDDQVLPRVVGIDLLVQKHLLLALGHDTQGRLVDRLYGPGRVRGAARLSRGIFVWVRPSSVAYRPTSAANSSCRYISVLRL